MRRQVLKIDFVDEAVDFTQKLRDFIGSVRIPLAQVLDKGNFTGKVPVIDEMNRQSGEVLISIKI